ncbi:dethiobiotin synthase [Ferrimonas sediminum]|uniref:ATP-dependent dethiobiotin synthetase BioD n=1 Tax=Ferrimonas sediminum TaxID=718193 RepID=A0A1G9ANC5_9GAMM|nr:dethiobiotin synthase [Ferrimonas sediminum]SDK28777.1 dethiobiotin synthase [Ferrimonas sediminum]
MTLKLFVTGTDTDIGKTLAARALLEAGRKQGLATAGYKPLAAGCEPGKQGLENGDALTLQAASSLTLAYDQINPYALPEPLSPHLAARHQGITIDTARLTRGLAELDQIADLVVVEGAGGWMVPVNDNDTLNHWVADQQLPVVLVVGIKLGCLNHALLSQRVIEADGLKLVGWIANHVDPGSACQQENVDYLRRHLKAPLLGRIPHLADPNQPLDGLIDLSSLLG